MAEKCSHIPMKKMKVKDDSNDKQFYKQATAERSKTNSVKKTKKKGK